MVMENRAETNWNMTPPSTASPSVNSTWEREEQTQYAKSPINNDNMGCRGVISKQQFIYNNNKI